jgi:predicted acetyltransferase
MKETLRLLRYDEIDLAEYEKYIMEWEDTGEKIIPGPTERKGLKLNQILDQWKIEETDEVYKKGWVPATLYFMVSQNNSIIGALNFRRELNDKLLLNGGHIGYGIRPSKRNKGYATKMLGMFLITLDKKKYDKVLLTCDEDNIGSYKTIENCGGKLWGIIESGGIKRRRYWIAL